MTAPLAPPDRHRLILAINEAKRQYPRPVSTVLIDYLQAYAEFGYRISATSVPQRLLDHLLDWR